MSAIRSALGFVAVLALAAAVPAQVIINEVHGFGAGSTPALPGDYLELWNQGSTPYSLVGHTLSVWVGDTGALTSVVIPCSPTGMHVIPGNCFWVIQEGGVLGAALSGTLAGLTGMQGMPTSFSSNSSMGIRLTDAGGQCVAYAYLRRLGTTLPATPPNLLAPCTWTLGDIGTTGTGLAHVQRLTNTNTNSYLDWGHDASANVGTPGAPNTTGTATQTALGACVPATGGLPYQQNSPGCSFDLNGLTNNGASPIDLAATVCDPTINANFASTNTGLGWDLAISTRPAVGAAGICGPGNGGFLSNHDQAVNVDLTDPALLYMNGGVALSTTTPFAGPVTMPVITTTPISRVTAQMHILSPSHPDGAQVSAAATLTILSGSVTTLAHTDDSTVTATFSSFCNAPAAGVTFYGTSYSSVSVISNGRVMFGAGDTDLSPTVAEALADLPFIGFWTDCNPAAVGSGKVTVSTANSLVTFRWNAVYYFGTTTPCTFEIVHDPATGRWTLDSLDGIVPNPAALGGGDAQFLGLSPGTAATPTNPGSVTFTPSGTGSPAATALIYDFWDGLAASAPNAINKLASLQSGTVRIEFTPAGNGYTWSAF